MKRKEDLENDNGDSQMPFPILCICLYLDYERVHSVYSIKLVTKILKIYRISRKLVFRDYHMGVLVIARSINPRLHYQAREL